MRIKTQIILRLNSGAIHLHADLTHSGAVLRSNWCCLLMEWALGFGVAFAAARLATGISIQRGGRSMTWRFIPKFSLTHYVNSKLSRHAASRVVKIRSASLPQAGQQLFLQVVRYSRLWAETSRGTDGAARPFSFSILNGRRGGAGA